MYYPLFLDLSHSQCLIVGAGDVGLRKAKGLLQAKAQEILVLDIEDFTTHWEQFSHSTSLRLEKRPFTEKDIIGKSLVFTCTANKELNAHIAALCAAQNILCNCTDAPHKGNCIVPALAKAPDTMPDAKQDKEPCLMAALSTEGASPAWAKVLRVELEAWLAPHAPMTKFLGKLRPLVLALEQDTRHNTALFRALVHSPLRYHLAEKKREHSEALLQELLPPRLHSSIAELLHDII